LLKIAYELVVVVNPNPYSNFRTIKIIYCFIDETCFHHSDRSSHVRGKLFRFLALK